MGKDRDRAAGMAPRSCGNIICMNALPTPTMADVEQVVRLVVERVAPERIVLFGSMARGDANPSDIDLMVVMPDGADCRAATRSLYTMRRHDVRAPIDFVVTTAEQYEQLRQRHTLVYRQIAVEGRELYAA